jgi:hypothetical protein
MGKTRVVGKRIPIRWRIESNTNTEIAKMRALVSPEPEDRKDSFFRLSRFFIFKNYRNGATIGK